MKAWRSPTDQEREQLAKYIHLKQKKDYRFRKWMVAVLLACAALFVLMAVYAENNGERYLVGSIALALFIMSFVDVPHNKRTKKMQQCVLDGRFEVFDGKIARQTIVETVDGEGGTSMVPGLSHIALLSFPTDLRGAEPIIEEYGPDNKPGRKCKGPTFEVCDFKIDWQKSKYTIIETGEPVLIVNPEYGNMTAYTQYMLEYGGMYNKKLKKKQIKELQAQFLQKESEKSI